MPEDKINLEWKVSYETILFDTLDGDIDKDQFCRWKGGFLIRNNPKNNANNFFVERLDTDGMEEVFITDEKGAYYDEFILPSGRKYRIPSTKSNYDPMRTVKNYPQPSKEVTDTEITEIIKDDGLWQ